MKVVDTGRPYCAAEGRGSNRCRRSGLQDWTDYPDTEFDLLYCICAMEGWCGLCQKQLKAITPNCVCQQLVGDLLCHNTRRASQNSCWTIIRLPWTKLNIGADWRSHLPGPRWIQRQAYIDDYCIDQKMKYSWKLFREDYDAVNKEKFYRHHIYY